MRLIIERSQADKKGILGGHKGVAFTLLTHVEFDERERQLLDHYKMWEYSLFTRGSGQLPVTIRNLTDGDLQTVDNVEVLLNNENIVKRSLDQVPPLLSVLGSFGGREVVEYPRTDTRNGEDDS